MNIRTKILKMHNARMRKLNKIASKYGYKPKNLEEEVIANINRTEAMLYNEYTVNELLDKYLAF